MPNSCRLTSAGRQSWRVPPWGLAIILVMTGLLLLLDSQPIHAQVADWTTLQRAEGGTGWDSASIAPAQNFVNIGGSGIDMAVTYSQNMRDGTPNIYGQNAPVPALQSSLRWTGNPANVGGAPGAADGPAAIEILFSAPIVINNFTVGSLSVLGSPDRYEWIEVRAYDQNDILIVTDQLTASTHTPPVGEVVQRPDSPAISEPLAGVYLGRGTSIQGDCADVCGYDRFTLAYVTTPVKRLELRHFATTSLTAESGLSSAATSVAVEGFAVAAPTYDFGDLPQGDGRTYGTTSAANGPSHLIRTTIFMGSTVDAEADGQPTNDASGDDLNPAAGPDDEDGVTPEALLLAEEQPAVIPVQVTNTTGRSGTLYGWIDFDNNGVFDQFENAQIEVPNGLINSTVTLDFGSVPVNNVTNTFARFRLATDGAAASPNRPAYDGEVEDYPVIIELKPVFDWGDAPDSYGTAANAARNGANHRIIPQLFLGATVDDETSGQPSANADGDDLAPAEGPDDEDGATAANFALAEGMPAVVAVQATNRLETPATLYGWIDFDGSGTFDFAERSQVTIPGGSENGTFNLNFGVTPVNGMTATYARLRLSTDPEAAGPVRTATDGEVEDYPVQITLAPDFDWGDAPDSYATDAVDSGEGEGPSHVLTGAVYLGLAVDDEEQGQPSAGADGDDLTPTVGPDDEDGLVGASVEVVAGQPLRVQVAATNTSANPARLFGWIDFNNNGRFEQSERAQAAVPAGSTNSTITLDFGSAPDFGFAQAVSSYARFRISTDTAAASVPTGPAGDGEVEDVIATILPRPLIEEPRPRFTTLYAAGTPKSVVRQTPLVENPTALPQSPDDRTPDVSDSFETGIDPAVFTVLNAAATGQEIIWGPDSGQARKGATSLWIGAGGADGGPSGTGATPPNLNTWLTLAKPIDMARVKAADIEFWLALDSEPAADTIFVGVSTDGINFDGAEWSGDSGGFVYFKMDLADYVGYPELYVAWIFTSSSTNAAMASGITAAQDTLFEGVWLDDVAVWTYLETNPQRETESLQNGSFEDGLADWQVLGDSTIAIVDATTPISGTQVAVLGGAPNSQDVLYQAVTLDDVADASAQLTLWFNIFGEETVRDQDEFCIRLYGQTGGAIDLGNVLVDLGCFDGVEAVETGPSLDDWRTVEYNFPADLWDAVRGTTIYVLLDMHTNETLSTTVHIDGVQLQILTDGTPGDRFEPNDFVRIATPVGFDGGPPLGEFIPDLTIDPQFDVDNYRVRANAGDRIRVDVDAQLNASPLDAAVAILSPEQVLLCRNDDDGASSDPFVVCDVTAAGEYIVEISSYDENSGRDHTYGLNVQVIPNGGEVPAPEKPPTPVVPNSQASWTAMIYLAGDTNLCRDYESTEFSIIRNLETQLGPKIGPGGFLNVVVLFDRNTQDGYCDQPNTTRYHIQPEGNYTVGLNLWPQENDLNMGDKATLIDFVSRAMRQFPADHYYLAIENHGNAIQGIAEDWSSEKDGKRDRLDTRELYSAFKTITDTTGNKLDVLGYEACLMGAYEAAYDVRNVAEYVFFFPTISYTNKESYPGYLRNPAFTAESDGRALGNVMFDVYQGSVLANAYVMTLAKTDGVQALQTAVNAWADALIQALQADPANGAKLQLARTLAQKINSQNSLRGGSASNGAGARLTDEDHYLDLYDLAAKVAAQGIAVAESQAVMQAVEGAVERTYARSRGTLQYGNTHGLTVFWPKTCGGEYRRYVTDQIFTSTIDGRWDDFLGAFFASVSEKKDERACLAAEYRNLIDRTAAGDQARTYLPMILR